MTDPAPQRIHDLLYKLREEIPGYAWAQVVHLETGEALAGSAVDPDVDATMAAGAYAQMLRCNGEALEHLGVGAAAAEDVLVTLGTGYVLLRLLGGGHFLGVAVTRQGTPGYARVVVRKYESLLRSALATLDED